MLKIFQSIPFVLFTYETNSKVTESYQMKSKCPSGLRRITASHEVWEILKK